MEPSAAHLRRKVPVRDCQGVQGLQGWLAKTGHEVADHATARRFAGTGKTSTTVPLRTRMPLKDAQNYLCLMTRRRRYGRRARGAAPPAPPASPGCWLSSRRPETCIAGNAAVNSENWHVPRVRPDWLMKRVLYRRGQSTGALFHLFDCHCCRPCSALLNHDRNCSGSPLAVAGEVVQVVRRGA